MGRSRRPKPVRLASKLLYIRTQYSLTQEQMLERLNYKKSPLYASQISDFEQGKREPPLLVLLQYARLAGLPMEALVDDEIDLPEQLPSKLGYEWIMRLAQKKRKNR
jgi:transcriptional regulator with XRE-family HTH domain